MKYLLILIFSTQLFAVENLSCLQFFFRLAIDNDEEIEGTLKQLNSLYKNSDNFYGYAHASFFRNETEFSGMSFEEIQIEIDKDYHNALPIPGYNYQTKNIVLDDSDYTNTSEGPIGGKLKYSPDMISSYAKKIASLRAGDVITFPNGKSFRVGKYLGRGALTHVYAIAGRNDVVLRLPMPSDGELSVSVDRYRRGMKAYEIGYQQLKKENPDNFQMVEILEGGENSNYNYFLVSRVDGHLEGHEYLEGNFKKVKEEIRNLPADIHEIMKSNFPLKLKKLLIASLKLSDLEEGVEGILDYYVLMNTRQFIYSESQKEWIASDWDLGWHEIMEDREFR